MSGFVENMSHMVNGKTKNKNIIYIFFFLAYITTTVLLLCNILFTRKITLFKGSRWEINCYIISICSLFGSHIWMYMATKYKKYIKEVELYFADDKNKKIKDKVYSKIWTRAKRWMTFSFHSNSGPFAAFVKFIYICTWIGLCFIIVYCSYCLGWIEENIYSYIAVIIFLISMFLNFFSYYCSIIFAYFIRNLSNKAGELAFNQFKPSNTDGFRNLVHASSRVAIAFFCESMMYILLLTSLVIVNPQLKCDKYIYLVILVFCALIPSLISFLIVFLCPKIFLNRLLRRWKRIVAQKLYENNKKQIEGKCVYTGKHGKKMCLVQERLNIIYNDNLPLVKTELFVAIVSCIIEIISTIIIISNR